MGDLWVFETGFQAFRNWFEDVYMGLNQAPIVVMIEHYWSAWKLLHVRMLKSNQLWIESASNLILESKASTNK